MRRRVLLAVIAAAVLPAEPAAAQIRASERAQVTQLIDGTRIEVDYARPRARGRSELFGGEVHWDEVWTPGANEATTLRVSRAVRVNGQALEAGRYSVWLVVKEAGDWTLLFDTDTTRFHTQRPDPDSVHFRVAVTPVSGPLVDVLTWSFPKVANDGGTLEMAWGTVHVPLEIAVEPTYQVTIAPEDAAPYEGTFRIAWQFGDDPIPPEAFTIEYHAADSTLRGRTKLWGEVQELLLIPLSEGVFLPSFLENGEVLETAEWVILEFASEHGRATSFLGRDVQEDRVIARGTRES
ncbi:MAG TPA: DUF2911 domain-containing protein [Longimicrobiales bacterium]|nr:DUF2911 domain-containing protein [Longimicrobiales bacterium]